MSTWIDKAGRRHVGVMVEGRRVHRILGKNATARDAKQVEAEIRASIARRVDIPHDPPLARVMQLYFDHTKTLRSEKTARWHAMRIAQWIEPYRASQAVEAAAVLVDDLRKDYQPATINRSLSALKKALTLAWKRNLIPENYGQRITRLPENNRRETTLTIAQVESIASCCSEVVRAAIWIALYTGCRRGEILALTKDDIGSDSITIRSATTKTLKARTIPIVRPLRPWLAAIPLSVNAEGVKSGFRRARVKAGLPNVTFHDLRRSCGTLMVQAGVDLYVVSKVLGHSSMNVTQQRYAHLRIDELRAGLERAFA